MYITVMSFTSYVNLYSYCSVCNTAVISYQERWL